MTKIDKKIDMETNNKAVKKPTNKNLGGQVEKTTKAKAVAPAKKAPAAPAKSVRYIESVGRRKTAVARVRYFVTEQKLLSKSGIKVNGKDYEAYFPVATYRFSLTAPLKTLKIEDGFIDIKIAGGGIMSQAEAAALGIARALVKSSEGYRKILRAGDHLTRDARAVERKKPGKTKARRGHQWRKR